MNRQIVATFLLGICLIALPLSAENAKHEGADKLGWKLTLQSWTVNKLTVYEAIDFAAQLGVHYLEIYPNQVLSSDDKGKFNSTMSDEQIKALLEKAKSANVAIIDCGVIGIPSDEAAARKFFDWVKKIGITTVVCDPDPATLPMLDKLAGEYGLHLAIHDHPKPKRYWDPEYTFSQIKDLKHFGFCADVGHWQRSGLVPVDVLKKYGDRVFSLHFKDLASAVGAADLHDVPWGTGESKAAEMLAVLKEKNFKGPIAIEYESQWNVGDLVRCIKFFDAEADRLAAQ